MKKSMFAIAAVVAAFSASAQSSIECRPADDGSYQAALIWQNTLGAERANAICQRYSMNLGLAKKTPQVHGGGSHSDVVAAQDSSKPGAVAPTAHVKQVSRFDQDVLAKAYASSVRMGAVPMQSSSPSVPPVVVQADPVLAGYDNISEMEANVHPDNQYMLLR
ncbi:hypothetical protein [Hydrogenophaga sp. NFH-34]|uniref:hypothetical protein n=1 Tax=Hydrogenophaga sp. NFH-34 TaxID=2744446 RepID=UPI001F24661E|nr:hypothetical protein [Hydrogenophaga sp. NFH-34]